MFRNYQHENHGVTERRAKWPFKKSNGKVYLYGREGNDLKIYDSTAVQL